MARTITYHGKKYTVHASDRQGKKYKVYADGKWVHFGAKGYTIRPGTVRGQSYCARSYGIGNLDNTQSANFWSRKMWLCEGKKSRR